MDRVRGELLPPVLIQDLHREAHQQRFVNLMVLHSGRKRPALVIWLGAALILAGCRLQTAGQRLTPLSPFAAPDPCGHSA
jgi:hypothetical protein